MTEPNSTEIIDREDEPFLAACDGFRAELVESGTVYKIYVQLTVQGEGAGAVCIWQCDMEECTVGEAQRETELVAAICRYMNAAGSWDTLHRLYEQLRYSFKGAEVELPTGWELLFCSYDVPDPTVIFAHVPFNQALVFKHMIYSETMSLEELEEQIRYDE